MRVYMIQPRNTLVYGGEFQCHESELTCATLPTAHAVPGAVPAVRIPGLPALHLRIRNKGHSPGPY